MITRKLTGVVLGVTFLVASGAPSFGATLTTQTIVSGLNRAVDLAVPPGDTQRLFVAERRGVIKIIDLATNTVLPTPFLDIDSLVVNFGQSSPDERGLLGFAFHPDYANNGFFYVYYMDNSAAPGDSIIARYHVSADPNVADPASALILKTIDQPGASTHVNHKAGCVKFGPDGKLYVGLGDGGNQNDTGTGHNAIGNGQFKGILLGKILRLDVDIASPYIPSDNPFVSDPNALGEIWMFGLRNPFRFSFDPLNGDMYIGDVGQNTWEEIDYIPAGTGAGRNLGWRCMEGNACFTTPSGTECTCNGANLTYPVLAYGHGTGVSVTGGIVYRGSQLPGEYGKYFYADYSFGQLWSFSMVGGVATGNAQRLTQATIVSFCADGNGEMYIVTGAQQSTGGTTLGVVRKIVTTCNTAGDINADCVRDSADAQILVDVLLGVQTSDQAMINRSDVNGDGFRDGLDIQAWINAL